MLGFTEECINWEEIEKLIPEVTGCNNSLCACMNDNFISFWETAWNLEDVSRLVEVVDDACETKLMEEKNE